MELLHGRCLSDFVGFEVNYEMDHLRHKLCSEGKLYMDCVGVCNRQSISAKSLSDYLILFVYDNSTWMCMLCGPCCFF